MGERAQGSEGERVRRRKWQRVTAGRARDGWRGRGECERRRGGMGTSKTKLRFIPRQTHEPGKGTDVKEERKLNLIETELWEVEWWKMEMECCAKWKRRWRDGWREEKFWKNDSPRWQVSYQPHPTTEPSHKYCVFLPEKSLQSYHSYHWHTPRQPRLQLYGSFYQWVLNLHLQYSGLWDYCHTLESLCYSQQ